jgi:hypothetical protein
LTEPRAGRRDAYHFGVESSPMSKMPRPNMPTVPSSVTADTAPDPYPTACWVNVRVAAMLRYIALVGLEAASVEVGAHSRTHHRLDLR